VAQILDHQYYLYLSGQDLHAIWYSSIDAYRAVMKYSQEGKDSLMGKHYAESREQNTAKQIA
jgi:hypothetical protein